MVVTGIGQVEEDEFTMNLLLEQVKPFTEMKSKL